MFQDMVQQLINLLPKSPFDSFISYLRSDDIQSFLQMLNWFVPVSEILTFLQLYLIAVVGYYTWVIILRFVNAIK